MLSKKNAQTEVYATKYCHPECSAVFFLLFSEQNVSMDEWFGG